MYIAKVTIDMKWTEEKIKQIANLLDEEKTAKEIADIFGVSVHVIRNVMCANRLYTKIQRFKWTDEKYALLVKMKSEGATYEQLANTFNCGHATISNAIKKLNLQTRSLKNRERYRGCNEDCEHCIYSDCLKPESMF